MEDARQWYKMVCPRIEWANAKWYDSAREKIAWNKYLALKDETFAEMDRLRAEILSGELSNEQKNVSINRINEMLENLKEAKDEYDRDFSQTG